MSNTVTDNARERVKLNEKFKNNDYFRCFKNNLKTTQVSHFQLEVKTIPDVRQINELAQFYDVEFTLTYDKEDAVINAVINIDKHFVDHLDGLISQFLRLNQQKQKDMKFNDRLSKLVGIYQLIFEMYTCGVIIASLALTLYCNISFNEFENIMTFFLLIALLFAAVSHFIYKRQFARLKSKFYKN